MAARRNSVHSPSSMLRLVKLSIMDRYWLSSLSSQHQGDVKICSYSIRGAFAEDRTIVSEPAASWICCWSELPGLSSLADLMLTARWQLLPIKARLSSMVNILKASTWNSIQNSYVRLRGVDSFLNPGGGLWVVWGADQLTLFKPGGQIWCWRPDGNCYQSRPVCLPWWRYWKRQPGIQFKIVTLTSLISVQLLITCR